MEVAQGVELHIDQWKGKEDFEINALLVPFVDYICILDTRQQQCVVPVSQDIRDRTNIFLAIQLAEDVHEGINIDLDTGALSKVLKWVSQGAYKPKLAAKLKVKSISNVSVPKPNCADQWDPNRGKS
ncbi:hypothetical protein PVK06_025461 [Gossypium arboreum]|uniref:Uncharacterized protein n=1 Tax=Gossypium arboreum TaxID=29729 RepID=A0ABR0PGJ9_GOSAR|nr:hypothetical protein PVK06_025461 [Gossypium arboreum]